MEERHTWVRGVLYPSLASGLLGGVVVGLAVSALFLPFSDSGWKPLAEGALIGGGLGFLVSWVGAILVGLLGCLSRAFPPRR